MLTLEEIEKRVILVRLRNMNWRQKEVAASLGISTSGLYMKLKRYRAEGAVFPETRVVFKETFLKDFLTAARRRVVDVSQYDSQTGKRKRASG